MKKLKFLRNAIPGDPNFSHHNAFIKFKLRILITIHLGPFLLPHPPQRIGSKNKSILFSWPSKVFKSHYFHIRQRQIIFFAIGQISCKLYSLLGPICVQTNSLKPYWPSKAIFIPYTIPCIPSIATLSFASKYSY